MADADAVQQRLQFGLIVGRLPEPVGFVVPNVLGLEDVVQLLDARPLQRRIAGLLPQQTAADTGKRNIQWNPAGTGLNAAIPANTPVPSRRVICSTVRRHCAPLSAM